MTSTDPVLDELRAADPVRPADVASTAWARSLRQAILDSDGQAEPQRSDPGRRRRALGALAGSLGVAAAAALVVVLLIAAPNQPPERPGSRVWTAPMAPAPDAGETRRLPRARTPGGVVEYDPRTFRWAGPVRIRGEGGLRGLRPPYVAELPPRPAVLFSAGVTYREAIRSLFDARGHGQDMPQGAVLIEPLPAGKAVQVRDDGRIVVDSATPEGWNLIDGWTGLPSAQVGPLPRCQVLLGNEDVRAGAPCLPDQFVREDRAGRWVAVSAAPSAPIALTRLGGQRVSLFDQPAPALGEIPSSLTGLLELDAGTSSPGCRIDATTLRRGIERNGRSVWVALGSNDRLQLYSVGPDSVGGTCQSVRALRRSAVWVSGRDRESAPWVVAGLVPDGFDTVRARGVTTSVERNTFILVTPAPVAGFVVSGPAGTWPVQIGRQVPPTETVATAPTPTR